MKLQQLRFLAAIAKYNLNISAAAEKLFTSQPGVSKQIKLLEEELGVQLFSRNGKHLTQITPIGERVIEKANLILKEAANIKALAEEFRDDNKGTLTLATTHTQARYVLPAVIRQFSAEFPEVKLNLIQGSPERISRMAVSGEADLAIATEAIASYSDLVMMPAYRWNRCLVVPRGHELTFAKKISLGALAQYPMVTYVKGLTGRGVMDEAFAKEGLSPEIVFTATDADVIKTYVRLGMGVGLIARQAYENRLDSDLVAVDVGHLFQDSITYVGFRSGAYMRKYMLRFLELFSPQFDRDQIEKIACLSSIEAKNYWSDVVIPRC
ncbi:transcriptional regulator CysB [gamma proteobacterium HTCC5015]|nr:transcriptional regulator CysB [gamma proteobacterium HTCC5015]